MFNLRKKLQQAKARKLERARQAKVASLKAAIKRGDTRRQHEAFKPAFDATNAALRAGLRGRV